MQVSNFTCQIVEDQQDNAHILESIYRLRYQVYVNEWGFENPQDHPEGLERDPYDQHSLHFYAYTDTVDNIIGTARLILDSNSTLPIEQHFDIHELPEGVPRNKIAEISRLAISKDFRRRAIDSVIFSRGESYVDELAQHQATIKQVERERRKCEHELIRGIYLLIYRESIKRGLTHWYAVMARGLHVILGRWGIQFKQVGPAREYHGLRAPYLLCIRDLERYLAKRNPELLELARQEAPGT